MNTIQENISMKTHCISAYLFGNYDPSYLHIPTGSKIGLPIAFQSISYGMNRINGHAASCITSPIARRPQKYEHEDLEIAYLTVMSKIGLISFARGRAGVRNRWCG